MSLLHTIFRLKNRKRALTVVGVSLLLSAAVSDASASPEFMTHFNDSTLRVDYIFGGGPGGVTLLLDGQSKSPLWAGRRVNLDSVPYEANGCLTVTDPATGEVLYKTSFSSLFHEWLDTEEASTTRRSFQNTYLLPLPKGEADITLTLTDNRHKPMASMTHRYSPKDELVALKAPSGHNYRYIHQGGDPRSAIDIAILAEGYTPEEEELFFEHASTMANEILRYEPFASHREDFNFVAVMSPSAESGVAIPLKKEWPKTAFDSHFSTFHSARYLTAPSVQKMYDALSGIPAEHIVILANTDNYGGGGIFNSYLMSAARNDKALPVTVHEFGHSFGGLADEYFYAGEEDGTYPLDIEPWEPNITTLVDFDSKWKHLVKPGTPVPTPWEAETHDREKTMKKASEKAKKRKVSSADEAPVVGVYEGGGYKSKGIYRPVISCRMRDNHNPSFCPVCREALERIIVFYTGK